MDKIQILSMLGSIIVLIPYALLGLRKMKPTSFVYSFMNFLGSVILMYVAIDIMQYGFIVLEVVWTAVSLYGMYRALKPNNKDAKVHAKN
jgi:formate hydrogenlyase subunit 3/multisubunit Na+/H+ antiporter MnhD subunit